MALTTNPDVNFDSSTYVKIADAGQDFSLTFHCPKGVRIAFSASQPAADSKLGHFRSAADNYFESIGATNACWIIAVRGAGHFTKTADDGL